MKNILTKASQLDVAESSANFRQGAIQTPIPPYTDSSPSQPPSSIPSASAQAADVSPTPVRAIHIHESCNRCSDLLHEGLHFPADVMPPAMVQDTSFSEDEINVPSVPQNPGFRFSEQKFSDLMVHDDLGLEDSYHSSYVYPQAVHDDAGLDASCDTQPEKLPNNSYVSTCYPPPGQH